MQTEQLKVSKKTQGFIECIILKNKLYSRISEALREMYFESDADRIMNDYLEAQQLVEKFINEYLCISIQENMSFEHEFKNGI